MPELPEVETTLRGIAPHIQNQKIVNTQIRHYQLRWPIDRNISLKLKNKKLIELERRAKYLLLRFTSGTIILHLGMSGRMRILTQALPPQKHDHIDIEFSNKKILRFTDPRRFGAFIWTEDDPYFHPLLKNLGPEPLDTAFSTNYLWSCIQGRTTPIKSLIMDSKVVVGVGNIYAAEALFAAGIHPEMSAKQVSKEKIQQLVKAIKIILRNAIKQGGTTLKDFLDSEGKPGYFVNYLKVYGREGEPCVTCKQPLQFMRLGQRSTVYCVYCQPRK